MLTIRLLLTLILLVALTSQIGIDDSILLKKCSSDSDCQAPYIVCSENTCAHKEVFPIYLLEFFGYFVLYIVSALSVSGGIGGGILFVPILIIFFNTSTRQATAISNGIVFINSFVKYICDLKKRNPLQPHRTITDY